MRTPNQSADSDCRVGARADLAHKVAASSDPTGKQSTAKSHRWRTFLLGLAVRLLGVALLWFGDGSPLWWRKAIVLLGVILSVGGIAVLRYLLITGLQRKK